VNKEDAVFGVVETLCKERGIVANRLSFETNGVLAVTFQGKTRAWDLHVECEAEEALALPKLAVGTPRALIPHVGYNGVVCVNDGQGLSVDAERKAEISAHTMLAGYDLLERWSADAESAKVEFYNELEGYWAGLPKAAKGRAVLEIDAVSRPVAVYHDHVSRPERWLFAERGAKLPYELHGNKLASQRGLYVHIEAEISPPVYPEILTHSFVDAVRSAMSLEQVELWNTLLGPSKNGPKTVALLVSIPRAAGGRSLVGAVFIANRGEIDKKLPIYPITVRRHTVNYMRERGGASLDLMGKHVAVLGCGAIGAVVADTLAASGVGKLTLVDHDEYSEDNVFRHVLEPIFIGLPKVFGLKVQLERKYPGLQIIAKEMTAQKWFRSSKLEDVDGVVLALGSPSLERSFSRALKGMPRQIPIVFTWLEALDLGGHSALMWANVEGCLDCLYRDDEGRPSLLPRTAFLEANQQVTRNLTGCASIFVPFGALQARRTALVASEHLLTGLTSVMREPSYRFWVGPGVEAHAHGLRTTPWWSSAGRTSEMDASQMVFGRTCGRCKGGK
jgi:hypothetical protein